MRVLIGQIIGRNESAVKYNHLQSILIKGLSQKGI